MTDKQIHALHSEKREQVVGEWDIRPLPGPWQMAELALFGIEKKREHSMWGNRQENRRGSCKSSSVAQEGNVKCVLLETQLIAPSVALFVRTVTGLRLFGGFNRS